MQRRGVHKCVHPLGYAVHHRSGQLTVMGHQVMNISEIVAMTLGIGCIRPCSGRDLEHCNIHRQFLPRSSFYRYRLGTVNSKSFVGKVLLRIKWEFELTYAL